jgi:uncharacterized protein YbaR (Trm112 family)
MPLPKDLLELVACPKCKGKVALEPDEGAFVCQACKLRYAVVDGVPNFLIEDAKPL